MSTLESIIIKQELDKKIKKYVEDYADKEIEKLKKELGFLDVIDNLSGIVKQAKGDRGDKGDAPTREELLGLIKPLIPDPIPGKDSDPNEITSAVYDQLINDPDFIRKTKGSDGEPGKTPTRDEILELIKPLIPQPIPGKNGSPDQPQDIKEKLIQLPILERWFDWRHIKNVPQKLGSKRLGRGTGNDGQIYDLSDSLDGVTKTFTIPANKRVLLIIGSSAPFFFRPTVDFAVSGANNITLTFDTAIDASIALATGQSLGIIYVEA